MSPVLKSFTANTLAKRSDLHLARKIYHVLAGSAGLIAYVELDHVFGHDDFIKFPFWIGFIALTIDLLRFRVKWINDLIVRNIGFIMRKNEVNSFSGLPFFAFGVAITLYLFPPKIAYLAVMFLVFADPIASFFGILYGKEKILPNKSLQGTLACFSTCYLLCFGYCLYYTEFSLNIIAYSLIAGLIGAISELLSVFIDDNFSIPVVSGLGLFILNYFIPIF